MNTTGEKHKPGNPWHDLRQRLLRSVVRAVAVISVVSLIMAVVMTISAGTAFMAGGVIALMPQLWFVLRGTSPKATLHAGGLALGKFSLSAAGFALWFAFVPTANPVLTLAGTATALLLSAVLMAGERWHARNA